MTLEYGVSLGSAIGARSIVIEGIVNAILYVIGAILLVIGIILLALYLIGAIV